MVRSITLIAVSAAALGCAARPQPATVPAPGSLGATISSTSTEVHATFSLGSPHSIGLVKVLPDGRVALWTDPASSGLVHLPGGDHRLAFPRPGTVIRAEAGPAPTGGAVPTLAGACFSTPPLGGRVDPGLCTPSFAGSGSAGQPWPGFDVFVIAMPYPVTADELTAALATIDRLPEGGDIGAALAEHLSRPGYPARWGMVPVMPLIR